MEERSLSGHPSSSKRPQSHSVSGESRGVPDGRSISPSSAREGRGTPGHHRSSTWEDQPFPSYHHQSIPVWEKRDPLTLNVNPRIGRPVSPQPPSASPRPNYDSGAWVLPETPRRERKEVSIQINQPDWRRSPVPPELLNPMQTQVLCPPADHQPLRPMSSPRISRNQRTPNSEEINADEKFSPMVPPWINSASVTPQPTSRNEVCPLAGMGEQRAVSYQPLDPTKEDLGDDDWIMVNPVKPAPQHITGTSSPVSPPVVHITGGKNFPKPGRDTQPKETGHKHAPKEFSKEHTSSQKRKNDVKLKEKTYLQAFLTHQKARFDLLQKRVEQARLNGEALRKEVSDMEAELHDKRTQMPSSFPTTKAISKLRAEKQGLLIDVECLQRDITLHLARQRESLQSDSFYQNIQPSNPYTAQPCRVTLTYEPKSMESSAINMEEPAGVSFELQHNDSIPKRKTTCDNKETLVTNTLEVQAALSQEEGFIHIENSGVELYFPKNSFYEDSHDHFIEMRIIPHCMLNEPAKSFTDDSSVMVELLPNNLRLRNPAVLKLPHCLVLKDCDKCKIQIFTSHHAKGENPVWEDITASTKYVLTESYCKIWLQRFCWVKYTIGDEQVEAKKLVLYTAGKRYKPKAKRATVDVGYYPHLPGENERFVKKSQNHIIGCEQSFIFRRTPKDDLCITFTKTVPKTWKILDLVTETIEYSKIESSCEQSCFFTLIREGGDTGLPLCTFKASQGERNCKLIIDMEHEDVEMSKTSDEPTSDEQEKVHSHICEQQNRNTFAATSVPSKSEGDFSIQLQQEPFSSYSNVHPVPHQQALVPTPSVNQFSYQQTLLVNSVNSMSLSQYPTDSNLVLPYPSWKSSQSSGYHPGQEETFPISYELMNELELKLGLKDPLTRNWMVLAEKLGFNCGEISYLEGADMPTAKVLREAFRRGYFKGLDNLIQILTDMKRMDVVKVLLKHKKDTEASK